MNYRDTGVFRNVEYDFKKMLYIFRIIEGRITELFRTGLKLGFKNIDLGLTK